MIVWIVTHNLYFNVTQFRLYNTVCGICVLYVCTERVILSLLSASWIQCFVPYGVAVDPGSPRRIAPGSSALWRAYAPVTVIAEMCRFLVQFAIWYINWMETHLSYANIYQHKILFIMILKYYLNWFEYIIMIIWWTYMMWQNFNISGTMQLVVV